MSRLPPLIALRAFESLGRTGSVRAAGDELGVSHTVVSRHVRNLEDRLQAHLLVQIGRGLVLTAEGRRFHEEIVRAFGIIEKATSELGRGTRRSLEVWCTPGVASRRLLPRLTILSACLADWEIVLRPTLSRPNLEQGEADAEIIYLAQPDVRPGRRVDLLARPRVFPVASPGFCARFGSIVKIEDLVSLPLIHEDSTEQWRQWFSAAGYIPADALHGPHLWHAHLATEAAKLGQGVALTNEIMTADEVQSGALLEIVSSNVLLGAYYLVSLAEHDGSPSLHALKRWLTDIFASDRTSGALEAPIAPN